MCWIAHICPSQSGFRWLVSSRVRGCGTEYATNNNDMTSFITSIFTANLNLHLELKSNGAHYCESW